MHICAFWLNSVFGLLTCKLFLFCNVFRSFDDFVQCEEVIFKTLKFVSRKSFACVFGRCNIVYCLKKKLRNLRTREKERRNWISEDIMKDCLSHDNIVTDSN